MKYKIYCENSEGLYVAIITCNDYEIGNTLDGSYRIHCFNVNNKFRDYLGVVICTKYRVEDYL